MELQPTQYLLLLVCFLSILKPSVNEVANNVVKDNNTDEIMSRELKQDKYQTDINYDDYKMNEAVPQGDEDLEDFDLDFSNDNSDWDVGVKRPESQTKEQVLREAMLKAMKKPGFREQIAQVIPILRVMSPTQRLTLAALVSSQIMAKHPSDQPSVTEVASMFSGQNSNNLEDHKNVTSELLLPISIDIAKMFRGIGHEVGRNLKGDVPSALHGLIGRRRLQPPTKGHKRPLREKPLGVNRRNGVKITGMMEDKSIEGLKPPPAIKNIHMTPDGNNKKQVVLEPNKDECEFFTNSLCLEVTDYPKDAILASIKRHQHMIDTLLTDFKQQSADESVEGVSSEQESRYSEHHYLEANRRQDGENDIKDFGGNGGYMCPSSVKYARPKRARTTTGNWKYIVNTGDYTQTLRLEMCLKPLAPCSYVTENFKSQCSQVYNYHRLLTWDEIKGLHMDIFKVPSCCSCHIQGYTALFPPNNEFSFSETRKGNFPGSDFNQNPGNGFPFRNPASGVAPSTRPVFPVGASSGIQNVAIEPHPGLVRPQAPGPVLLDHLVPPGPPLPLENEVYQNNIVEFNNELRRQGNFTRQEHEAGATKVYPTFQQRPIPHEVNRVLNDPRLPTKDDSREDLAFGTKIGGKKSYNSKPAYHDTRDYDRNRELGKPARVGLPNKETNGNLRFPQNNKPNFAWSEEDTNQPSVVYQPQPPKEITKPPNLGPFKNKETQPNNQKKETNTHKIHEQNFGYNPDLVIQPGSKPDPSNKPIPFFNPEVKTPKYPVTSPAPFYTSTNQVTSTTVKTQKKPDVSISTGQKRINYNYHPIIDFFNNESSENQLSIPSKPFVSNQDWKPVVGHP